MTRKVFICILLIISFSLQHISAQQQRLSKNKDVGKQSIDVPDDLDKNYDELLTRWAGKGNHIECDFIDESPVLFNDSTYIKRLYALPSRMELAYNDLVKGFIEMYAGRRRGQVSYMLGQGSFYFPMFEEALDREGLPLELKYLPVIESALNPVARSRAGASGLWQFMPATGKLYKLEINSLVDERRDPYKSTQAAVKYLKDMYGIYEDWNLVIAAYNCGPGNVNKAIKRSGGKKDYWDIYPYLPKETRGYVPAFIAATYIMNYHQEHKICPATTELPALVDTLGVDKMLHFEQIADIVNVSVNDIRILNPQYKEDIIPGEYKKYALKLPLSNLSTFIDKKDIIYNHRKDELLTHKQVRYAASKGNAPASGGYATYRVKSGDNLGAIGTRHGVSVAQLKNWNGLKSDNISINQTLRVSDYIAPPKVQKESSVNDNVQEESVEEFMVEDGVLKKSINTTKMITSDYQVRKGDTWAAVVKQTGASAADIKKWNGVKNGRLVTGTTLKIHKMEVVEEFEEIAKPEDLSVDMSTLLTMMGDYVDNMDVSVAEPVIPLSSSADNESEEQSFDDHQQKTSNIIYHKVVYGETLSQIAVRYGVTVEQILLWNNITSESAGKVANLFIILPEEGTKSNVAEGEHKSDKDAV